MALDLYVLVGGALLLLIGVVVSKLSDRFGVPALLLFLLLGMVAGSEGPGGIYFDDPTLAQNVSVVALVLILFSGALGTDWEDIRHVIREGPILATLGVAITAVCLGLFAHVLLRIPLLQGLLLGAIVSSTDAAAVFSVLRSKGVSLKGRLKPLLELESGSNDPMAIFLTLGIIRLITEPGLSPFALVGLFFSQMLIGAVVGYVMGRVLPVFLNRIRLNYEGLYPVLTLACVLLTFGLTSLLGGSGFLAVYVTGVVMGNVDFVHRRSLTRFHDGIAWLSQITMFLTLGLFVFPSRLLPTMGASLLLAAFLMLVARPLSVFIGLAFSPFRLREKLFASWVGLRGAAPIILATFPLLAGVPGAAMIFNVVFFVVLTSVLLQGTSIPIVARWLQVEAPIAPRRQYPIEFTPTAGMKSELQELPIPPDSRAVGKAIVELNLPDDFLVVLIARDNDFVLPNGGTVLQSDDVLLALTDADSCARAKRKLGLG